MDGMKLFMFRWPNGTTSMVGAPTQDEAFLFADCEWGDPYEAEVTVVKRFAMDVTPRLTTDEEGYCQITFDAELGCFGGSDDFDPLNQLAYPLVAKAFRSNLSSSEEDFNAAMQTAFNAEQGRKLKTPVTSNANVEPSAMDTMMGWKPGSPMLDIYKRCVYPKESAA